MFKALLLLLPAALVACSRAEPPAHEERSQETLLAHRASLASNYALCTSLDTALLHPILVKTLSLGDSIADGKGVAAQIRTLPNLKALWLSGQSRAALESLFDALGTVDSLQELQLARCDVDLTGNLRKVKTVRKLGLHQNGKGIVPLAFLQRVRLTSLTIQEDRFVLAGPVPAGHPLQELALYGYAGRRLPGRFDRLAHLKELRISSSSLTTLEPEITALKGLRLLLIIAPLSHDEKALLSLRTKLGKQRCQVMTEQDLPRDY